MVRMVPIKESTRSKEVEDQQLSQTEMEAGCERRGREDYREMTR